MKFSIVTPVLNGEKYIARTIESVISQEGDFEIEYIIQDGLSSDSTKDIVSSYRERLKDKTFPIRSRGVTIIWNSEKDVNSSVAINRGFTHATGEIQALIPGDDIFFPGSFKIVAETFKKFPDVKWLCGISEIIDENDKITRHGKCLLFRRDWLAKGVYGRNSYFVPFNALFWKSELWEKAGCFKEDCELAGDYGLLIKFAKHEKLWSLNFPVSAFRRTPGQLSENIKLYKSEQQLILPQTKYSNFFIRAFFSAQSRLNPRFQNFFLSLYRVVFLEKDMEYIDVENNSPIKKPAYSYIAKK